MTYSPTRLLVFLILPILVISACSGEKSVEQYLQDGRKYLERGELSKAIASLEDALRRDPELAEAHLLLGEALARSERWPETVKQFEAYQALVEDDAAGHFALGQAYVRTGELGKAASTFAEGVRVDPSFLETHREEIAQATDDLMQAGKEALDAGDLETATDLLSKVAPLVPGQGDVYFLLGQAHRQANDLAQALSAFATAISLSPEVATEHTDEIKALTEEGFDAGQAALDAGDLNRAARVLESVTAVLPNEPKAHFLLGNVYNQADQLAQAIERYQTVLSLEPDSSSAHTNIGVVYYKMNDLDAAIKEYKIALELEPDDAETHYLLGAAYVQMEQVTLGKTEFETALELDPELAPPYIGLGHVYLLEGQMDDALEMANASITLSPSSPEAYFLLAQVHIQLNNVDEARAALKNVLSLNPSPHWREQAELMLQSLDSE